MREVPVTDTAEKPLRYVFVAPETKVAKTAVLYDVES